MDEEVGKLLDAGFIREVKYITWLSNVVMVKMSNGKWRMCIDFTDLNKACPKDTYPLPSIDGLVDGVSGYEILNFWMHTQGIIKSRCISQIGRKRRS